MKQNKFILISSTAKTPSPLPKNAHTYKAVVFNLNCKPLAHMKTRQF